MIAAVMSVDAKTRSMVDHVLCESERKVGVPGGRHRVRSSSERRWMRGSVWDLDVRWWLDGPVHSGWCWLKSPTRIIG